MTWKNGSAYSSAATGHGENSAEQLRSAADGGALPTAPTTDEAVEQQVTDSAVDRFKARSMKMIRRSRKKSTLRRAAEIEKRRVVHFDIPVDDGGEERTDFARFRPFRRSSKFRQPLRRVSRAKGSPPPSCLARIHQVLEDPLLLGAGGKLEQPNFDATSDRESEEEEDDQPLPPSLLEGLLRNETAASDGERSDGETSEETYTVLPATTVEASTTWEDEEGARHVVASNPLASKDASTARSGTLVRRRSSYRIGVRNAISSTRRSSVRRQSIGTTRRCSIVTRTGRRRSSALPGYVFRRRSGALRSAYKPNSLQQRKRRRHRRRRPRKIVLLGDMCSGKTSLISAYCQDRFSDIYVPTILTSCMTDADVLGERIELVIVEVAGRTDYAKIRRCAYHKMDLVILCYSADSPSSLAAIETHWLPELLRVSPLVPYILVGTKKDIRDLEETNCEMEISRHTHINTAKNSSLNSNTYTAIPGDEPNAGFVSTRQGLEVAKAIEAHDFIECSAMYRDGTREVFETAAKLALRRSPRRKKNKQPQRADTCTIL